MALLSTFQQRILIKAVLWCTCWILISYLLGFGTIFLCISIIYFIFNNLGRRKEGELSAYSMFNDNNERIAGTFDAQFYEDMMRGKKGNATFDGPSIRTKTKTKSPKSKGIKHPKRMSKWGNKKCPCGSGKKYKKCCMKSKVRAQQKAANLRKSHEFDLDSPSTSDSG